MTRKSRRVMLLEAGIAVSCVLVVAALGAAAISRVTGSLQRELRRREPRPEPGTLPSTRHQQIAVASPR